LIRAVLTDIEGTTSSIAFVKDVLFPYAREHMADFVRSHSLDPEVRALLDEVCTEAGQALNGDEIIVQLMQWIDEDKKITPLKILQGMIWEQGYHEGAYTGHVYPDAAEKLKDWHAQGIKLYIYSSGSIPAQKLLFKHSDFGDMTPLFSGYFDTRTGNKREAESYRAIVKAIGLPANEILFLSDIAEELDAARTAGMQTTQLVRAGDGTQPSPDYLQAQAFTNVSLSG
jgi:enolase-phosphatase E1